VLHYLVGGAAEPCVPDGTAVPEEALHAESPAAVVLIAAVDAHDPDLVLLAVGHDGLVRLLARHPDRSVLPALSLAASFREQIAAQIKIQRTI
jgi:hypothetical protein